MTRVPSVAGVDEALLFSRCLDSLGAFATFFCQTILPVAESRRTKLRSPFSSAVVTNTLPAHTIGDECPSPGNGVFHLTFCVALHCKGAFVSALVPSPRGPRNSGQFSPSAHCTQHTIPISSSLNIASDIAASARLFQNRFKETRPSSRMGASRSFAGPG